MSRISGCLWLGVALVLALVAGGAAFITLQRASVAPAGQTLSATTSVVVAAHPVAIGSLLSEADLTVQSLPTGALPMGTMAAVGEAAGQVSTVPLNTGEMVLADHLTKPDITALNAAFTLPEGKVAVTLASDDLLSDVSMVQAADHVNVMYSLKVKRQVQNSNAGGSGGSEEESEERQYTFGTLQNVTVVSVMRTAVKEDAQASTGDAKEAKAQPLGAARAYILALDPQDALVLKYLKDAGAAMDLALRNVTDETDHVVKPVDIKYVVDRYQLPVCQADTCNLPVR